MDDLIGVLAAPERPPGEWRIGAESEKFGVHEETGAPLAYDGEFGVLRIFDWLMEQQTMPTAGDVLRLGPYALRDKKRRDRALDKLAEHGLVREQRVGKATLLDINPSLRAQP